MCPCADSPCRSRESIYDENKRISRRGVGTGEEEWTTGDGGGRLLLLSAETCQVDPLLERRWNFLEWRISASPQEDVAHEKSRKIVQEEKSDYSALRWISLVRTTALFREKKNSWSFPKLLSLLSAFDFSHCGDLQNPKMLAFVTITMLRKGGQNIFSNILNVRKEWWGKIYMTTSGYLFLLMCLSSHPNPLSRSSLTLNYI